MHHKISKRVLTAAALVLSAVCTFHLTTLIVRAAAESHKDWIVNLKYDHAVTGIARGQALRVSLSNLVKLEGRAHDPVEVSVRVLLYDEHGAAIAQAEAPTVPLGWTRSFDFDRAAITLPGESGTGRLEVRTVLEVHCSNVDRRETATIAEEAAELLPASLESIDKTTGKTTTVIIGGDAGGTLKSESENDCLIGIAADQTLRFTVFNPRDSSGGGITKFGSQRLTLNDGSTVVESGEVTIPPGEFRSFDVKYADLRLTGEPGTGRVELRGKITFRTQPGSARSGLSTTTSVELLDSNSGKTTAQGRGVFILSTDRHVR